MTKAEFERIVSTFISSPDDLIPEKGGVYLISIDNTTLSVRLDKGDNGELFCVENDNNRIPAEKWIINRLAKLDILAHAILERITPDNNSIPIPAIVPLEEDGANPQKIEDARQHLARQINESKEFVTSVYYLISEAGEGKTHVMHSLARSQADAYLKRETKWLFLPIELSGRPFLRLDEMIIGTLVNSYRFKAYFIESFLEMVREGHIVLGLDGFEEMTIEGAEGDIISSLGNLLNGLHSEGRIVFATRTAYYSYVNLLTQARIFDAFRDKDIEFNEMRICKWTHHQFITLMLSYGFSRQEAIDYYNQLANALSGDHPILTRAVLARRLVEELYKSEGSNITSIIAQFKSGNKTEVIGQFVMILLNREAQRWINPSELRRPLLTVEQHEVLLETVAEEMWLTNMDVVKQETLFTITEVVCSSLFSFKPQEIAKCKEKILHHALIRSIDGTIYSFCHEEFHAYFLGYFLASSFIKLDDYYIRRIFDKKIIPLPAIQECCRRINTQGHTSKIISFISTLLPKTAKTSCLNQNLSTMQLLLIEPKDGEEHRCSNMYIAAIAINGLQLNNIVFENCLFEHLILDSQLQSNLSFVSCTINSIAIRKQISQNKITFDEESIPSELLVTDQAQRKTNIYAPYSIRNELRLTGVSLSTLKDNDETIIVEEESVEVTTFFKIIEIFHRKTGLTENLLRTKFGTRWSQIKIDVFDPMLKLGVFHELQHRGSGKQNWYKLNESYEFLLNARKNCLGKFSALLEILRHHK